MAGEWHFVAAVLDVERQVVRLVQEPLRPALLSRGAADVESKLDLEATHDAQAALTIAGFYDRREDGALVVRGHYNGKIEAPRLFASALGPEQIEALRLGTDPAEIRPDVLVGAWDFSRDISSARARDTSGNGLDGEVINLPMRAVTGRSWTGREIDWRRAAHEYGAIYFHDDDLENANWGVDSELDIPDGFRSGVYALRLRAGAAEDYLPFFVRPRRGTATAPIAFLAPTNSYLAYANEHFASGIPGWKTDRGRIYIVYGKPDEIETHPSGGAYQRETSEGGR